MINYESAMKKAGHVFRVEALHVKDRTGKPEFVEFFPYLEGFTENYDSSWNEEDVFGRMDGIPNFVGVKRSFTLSIRIAAHDFEQARSNQIKLSTLIRFIYPSVTQGSGGDNSYYFRGAPIIKLKFGNIIRDALSSGGLYGYIQGGLSITPSHEHGWFVRSRKEFLRNHLRDHPQDDIGPLDTNVILYKYFDISFTFKVLHNHTLGNVANEAQENAFEHFPYGFSDDMYVESYDDTGKTFSVNPNRVPPEEFNTLLDPEELDADGYSEYGRQIKAEGERYMLNWNLEQERKKRMFQPFGK